MPNVVRSFLLALLVAPLALADSSRSAAIDQILATLGRVQSFQSVAIAPDGQRVAYVRTDRTSGDGATGSAIYVEPFGGGAAVRITAAESAAKALRGADESGVAWSPDGNTVAFLSNARGGPQQLYVASANGSGVVALTSVVGALSMPRWSPDGKSIALLFIENASRKGGALEAMTPPSGDVALQVEEQRIAVVDVATKNLAFATPGNMFIYDYDWSPDGRSFIAEAAFGSGENNYWIAEIWRFDRQTRMGRPVYKPALQIASPRWSPDGRSIAFIEGLMSDQGVTGGDIFVVPAEGGAATNLTPGLPASPASLQWLPGSREILFGENVNGRSGFARVSAAGGAVTQLWSGEEHTAAGHGIGLSLARDGVTSAVIRESFTRPPEVWSGRIGAWTAVTHANDGIEPLWGQAENLNWQSDGLRVQGWLLQPKQTGPAQKRPMVVQIHGGPSSGAVSSWPQANLAALLASGYTVLLPNPRGSYGQGEAFTRANVKDFGYGDFRDILRGVDAAVAAAPIDRDRVGIWGWSYGGYMTMWAVTQTTRFKAAVAGAGIVNWQSYYGQNSIDQWMIPFFGASVYDDPWIYTRSSPISFIKNVKTPTLVLVGDRDGEVPSPQSFEFWHALKTLGVRTQLIVYPNEGHRMSSAADRKDITTRLVGWFDANL